MNYNNNDLITKLTHASNTIAKASRSGSGNFIIASTQVANAINELSDKMLEEARQKKFEKRKRTIDKLLKSES
jgi:hypothetical protein